MSLSHGPDEGTVWQGMSESEIVKTGLTRGKESLKLGLERGGHWEITRDRCFLELTWTVPFQKTMSASASSHLAGSLHGAVSEVVHVPGLRTSPERTYPVAAVGSTLPGTFDKYTATVIYQLVKDKKEDALAQLTADMKLLALTSAVSAIRLNDAQIELQVGRLPNVPPKRQDFVNIADVGIGVSQALPVVTALLTARRGQLVYLEQPETHLHPRAQAALAQVLVNAANRGVQVVAETHSSLLILGIQALVAEGKLAPGLVKLHWFKRDAHGVTTLDSADLDEAGAFGEWPEDFDDVELKSQSRYMDAAEVRRMKKRKPA